MKGFSLKRWIEQFRNENPKGENDNFQEWSNYYGVAYAYDDLKNLSKEQIKDLKQKYIEVQKKEATDNGAIFNEMEQLKTTELESLNATVPTEESIRMLIGMVAAGVPFTDDRTDLNKVGKKANIIINTYVSEGYNIYPMLTSITKDKQLNEEKSKLTFTTKDGKPATINDGIHIDVNKSLDEIKNCSEDIKRDRFGIRVLENAEELSPYKEVFDISDKIGELNRQMNKALDSGDPEFDLNQTLEQIDALKGQLTTVVSGFDPDFLLATADSRLDYLNTIGSDMKYVHAVGLREIKTSVAKAEQLQEQQAETNMESGKTQFTGVMGETPNAKDGIHVVPRT